MCELELISWEMLVVFCMIIVSSSISALIFYTIGYDKACKDCIDDMYK